jgi:hypothetical protein
MSLIRADGGLHRPGAYGWETIRYALDSNARTVRLCVILLTMGIAGIPALLVVTHGWLW